RVLVATHRHTALVCPPTCPTHSTSPHLAEGVRKPPRLAISQCWSAEQHRQAPASRFVGHARASGLLVAGRVRRRRHGVYGILAIT
ncbi:hypothetical protein, partial [Ardenticatena maritima]|uniref:hypothetical protein n=1 Tax=Ardenticatena maritima TaxID=872965 RepID=UPI001F46A145